MADKKFCHFR